jgi:hypothetical protein
LHEYVLRVRPSGDEFTATLRPVEPHSTVDATYCGSPICAVANNEFAAMIGAIANARIPTIPAGRLPQPGDRHNDSRRSKPCHGGYPTVDTPEGLEAPQEPLSEPTDPDPCDELIRELFVLWPAWQELVDTVALPGTHPSEADPQSIYGATCALDRDRLAARLYGGHIGDTLSEAGAILTEIMRGAMNGHRPRTGRELGLTREMFEERG